jgi:hypothetical protein
MTTRADWRPGYCPSVAPQGSLAQETPSFQLANAVLIFPTSAGLGKDWQAERAGSTAAAEAR